MPHESLVKVLKEEVDLRKHKLFHFPPNLLHVAIQKAFKGYLLLRKVCVSLRNAGVPVTHVIRPSSHPFPSVKSFRADFSFQPEVSSPVLRASSFPLLQEPELRPGHTVRNLGFGVS